MNNKEFKEILSEVGMSKKDFAEKVGLAYQTVAGWTNQGYPLWVDSYTKMMTELHRCKTYGPEFYDNLTSRASSVEKLFATPSPGISSFVQQVPKEERRDIERLEAEVEKVREEFSKELNELKKRINPLSTPDNP